ncbi:MAG: hypothetical protein AB7P23_00055 [Amphiplicatus sp.]
MSSTGKVLAAVAVVLLIGVGVYVVSERDDDTVGEAIEDAADDVGDAIDDAADDVEDAADDVEAALTMRGAVIPV